MTAGFSGWLLDRISTDLAIVAVAVPMGLDWLVPPYRGPGACGTTLENGFFCWGALFLAARFVPSIPKALMDLDDRFAGAKPSKSSHQEDS